MGGIEAQALEFPFLVSMSMHNEHFCGGSIITRRCIITAAHCVANITLGKLPLLQIRAGSLNYRSGGRVYFVDDILWPSLYDKYRLASPYDIAIVKLKTLIRYDQYIQPIAIARSLPDPLEVAASAGWGLVASHNRISPLEQRKVDMLIISERNCSNAWKQVIIDEKVVCAFAGEDAGVCDGDSGGPLIYDDKLVGIVAWGSSRCGAGLPDVFTSVPYFLEWIQRIAQLHLHY
uniref:Peptidase S1 domain-containing protein n=1 Tax=Bracon brevicornis TaxID=1563983 RepID=A0A6V7KHJ3_9HYME